MCPVEPGCTTANCKPRLQPWPLLRCARKARQVTVLANAMPSRGSTGSVRLRCSCQHRRAAVVPRMGRFSGVDQGRHVNHLLVGLPHLVLNMGRLPGCLTLSMRTTGSPVDGGHGRTCVACRGRLRPSDVGSVAARSCCTFGILTFNCQRTNGSGGGRSLCR